MKRHEEIVIEESHNFLHMRRALDASGLRFDEGKHAERPSFAVFSFEATSLEMFGIGMRYQEFLANEQEDIRKALKGEIPAEQWMADSRRLSAADADSFANMMGCLDHLELGEENLRDAKKLERLISENTKISGCEPTDKPLPHSKEALTR